MAFARSTTIRVSRPADTEAVVYEANVPVWIELGPAHLDFRAMRKDGWDIQFVQGVTECPHYRVLFDKARGAWCGWVNIPVFADATTEEIIVNYGDGAVSADPSDFDGAMDQSLSWLAAAQSLGVCLANEGAGTPAVALSPVTARKVSPVMTAADAPSPYVVSDSQHFDVFAGYMAFDSSITSKCWLSLTT